MTSQTINLLKDLIKIPSYVGQNINESRIGKFVFDYLNKNTGLIVERQVVEEDRFNIVAYHDLNPDIIFFSHLDTVLPNDRDSSCTNPLEKNGRIYGLGSVDMKSGLAVILSIAKKFKEYKNVAYIFTVDEEYDFKGAKALIKNYKFKPEIIINPEPTSLKILNGCRGVTEFTIKIHGKSCHAGSKHLGVNAIEKSVELFNRLQQEVSNYDNEGGKNSVNLAGLNGGILRGTDTIISSGNIVPNYATCVGEVRVSSNKLTENSIKKIIVDISKKIGVKTSDIEFKFFMKPAFTPKSKLIDFEGVLRKNKLEPIYGDINSSGYFEVQFLQENWGGDIIVFGPGPAEMAHQDQEYVKVSTVEKTETVFEEFIKKTIFG